MKNLRKWRGVSCARQEAQLVMNAGDRKGWRYDVPSWRNRMRMRQDKILPVSGVQNYNAARRLS